MINRGEKGLKKIKTFIVFLILMLLTLQTTTLGVYVTNTEKNEKIELSYQIFESDSIIEEKKITIDKQETALFGTIIERILDRMGSDNDLNLNEILNNLELDFGSNTILSLISKITGFSPLRKGAFIISEGYGRKIDFRSTTEFRMRKSINFWHYIRNTDQTEYSMTLTFNIIPNRELRFTELTEGWQIGLMRDFKGIYLRLPGNVLQNKNSHTFFVGYASRVNILDLPDPLRVK